MLCEKCTANQQLLTSDKGGLVTTILNLTKFILLGNYYNIRHKMTAVLIKPSIYFFYIDPLLFNSLFKYTLFHKIHIIVSKNLITLHKYFVLNALEFAGNNTFQRNSSLHYFGLFLCIFEYNQLRICVEL